MKTPNPLAMSNGIYRGSLDLHIGPGRDFYFGERGTASHSVITLNFELTVAHDFQVSFPPGSDRVVLQPVGGWAPWIDHGRVPGALKNEIPFTVSSSAPFSIALQCQYPVGDQCGIRSDSDDTEVPIEVAISMPGINAMATSTPAMHQRLDTRGRVGFDGAHGYVAHRPSRLHVGVSGQPLATMLKQSGSHWRGQVTVIFDTEL